MNRSTLFEKFGQQKKNKYLFICALFLLLFQLIPSKISKGCGSGNFGFKGYSFINPGIISQEAPFLGYFSRFGDFYQTFEQAAEVQEKSNVEEWQDIFCGIPSIADIEEVIYKANTAELMQVLDATEDEYKPLKGALSGNSFAKHLKNNQCTHTVEYIIFAKRCEPHVIRQDAWNPEPKDFEQMQYLINVGKKAFKKTKSNYIKLRYAYQLIRMAHYMNDYQQTVELYDDLLPKTDKIESILNYWIEGHRAGALKKLGKKVEAAYLFSKIFQYAPSKRESAFRSFHVETDEEWEACLLMCQTDGERAMLYALRANADHSKAAYEMDHIYQLDPTNENLELLLVKEIKKLEKDFLGLEFNNHKSENKSLYNIPRPDGGAYLVRLHELVRKCIKEQKVLRPELWMIADGYLEFLSNDFYAAERTFDKLEPIIKNPILKEQLAAFRLALNINLMEGVDEEDEEDIATIFKDNKLYKKFRAFPDFINDKLAFEYARTGYPGKAFRCQHNLRVLKPNPQIDIIEDLLEVCRKEEPTKFERALISYRNGETMEIDLMDMKGTYLMTHGNWEAALEVFKRIPKERWNDYQENPFHERLEDNVHKPVQDTVAYNKVEIIEKIFEMEYQAKADYKKGAELFYQLGIAHYNMTYFGHAWHVMDYFRSGRNWEYRKLGIFDEWYLPYGNKENQDCTKAQFYFEKTIELTEDTELATKAAFMAAKCEQNAYFTSKDCTYFSSTHMPDPPEEYRRFYQMLKTRFNGTDFYNKIFEECKYFKAYATK